MIYFLHNNVDKLIEPKPGWVSTGICFSDRQVLDIAQNLRHLNMARSRSLMETGAAQQ
jgi:hypothetical protein